MYDCEIGKFIQVDKLYEQAQNFSSYRYAFCNPILFIDPDGNFETNYVDENGKTIINTNDGNDRVVEVKEENRKTFDTYVKIGKEKGAIDGEYYNKWMTAKMDGHDYIFPSNVQFSTNQQNNQEASTISLPLALSVAEKGTAPIAAAAVGWNIGDLIGKNVEAVSTATAAILTTIIAEENLYGKVLSDSYGEHTKGARPSTKGKHEKGQARKGTDRGGEKGDSSRRPPQ